MSDEKRDDSTSNASEDAVKKAKNSDSSKSSESKKTGKDGKKNIDAKKTSASSSAKKTNKSKNKHKRSKKNVDVKTFKPVPPLAKNPIVNILDQHQQHKLRIAKLITFIAIAFGVLFFLALGYEHWNKQKKINHEISVIETKLDLFKAKIAKNSGFLRNQAIAQAIILTYKGEQADWNNIKAWEARRKELFDKFESGEPEFSKNFVVPTVAVEMMAIPQGEFLMGRTINEVRGCTDELPQRKVKIDYPFWAGKTEIANYQYRFLFPQHTEREYDSYPLNMITQPVVQVSWHNANQYCKMLTFHEQKKGRVPPGYEYRLPTEAEWEYLCRATTDTYFYWGNTFGEIGKEYANALDRHSAEYEDVPLYQESPEHDGHYVTAPVASFKPNAFGLYDVSGNVWEWCWDWYNPGAYRDLPNLNPIQSTPVVTELTERGNFERIQKIESTSRVIRGGGWLSPPSDCRSATRDSVVPETKDNGIGFRIVLAPTIEMLELSDSNGN